MSASTTQVPARLQHALDSQRRWGEAGVHLVPVRHHSPACALALSALLEKVHPATVLIEGPVEYAALLPSLQDPRTVPPVALLSLGERTASYYPLAEFSPEWVALRWAGQHGAEAAFIDRSACLRDDDDPRDDARGAVARTLQAERYLARSRSLDALARRLGCRDHDEVWEHLFEDRATADIRSWRGFFSDTLAWAGLARLDVEREVLDTDGTHAREAVMAAALRRYLPESSASNGADGKGSEAPAAPVAVVTGGFHTMALLDCLDATEHAAWLPEPQPQPGGPAWLIRYDYARLDALRGYGAGMPSPGLWQRAWRARTGAGPLAVSGTGSRRAKRRTARPAQESAGAARAFATTVVIDVAVALRGLGEPLGTAQVLATVEQAMRLAALRGRAWPGRCDILDALTSCLVKDETGLSGNLGAAVASVLAASDVGEVPDGIATPPLVRQVRDRLRAAHELQRPGGQPDHRLRAEQGPGIGHRQVLLAQVHPMNMSTDPHSREGDIATVIHDDARGRVRPLDRPRHRKGQLQEAGGAEILGPHLHDSPPGTGSRRRHLGRAARAPGGHQVAGRVQLPNRRARGTCGIHSATSSRESRSAVRKLPGRGARVSASSPATAIHTVAASAASRGAAPAPKQAAVNAPSRHPVPVTRVSSGVPRATRSSRRASISRSSAPEMATTPPVRALT